MNDTTPLDPAPLEPAGEPPRPGRRLRSLALGIIGGVAAAALTSGGIALASTTGTFPDNGLVINSSPSTSDDRDLAASPDPTSTFEPITDDVRAALEAAALEAVGGGTVVDVRRGDDPGEAYRVTVRLANGDLAEVRLADDLSVLRVELDNSDSDDDSDDVAGDDGNSGSDDDGTADQGGSGSDDSGSDDSGSDDSGSDDSGSDD